MFSLGSGAQDQGEPKTLTAEDGLERPGFLLFGSISPVAVGVGAR